MSVAHPDRTADPQPVVRGGSITRRILNALLAVTVAGVITSNLPDSALRRRLLPPLRPYVNALGLDQAWNLFSPDPSRRSISVEARLRFADGTIDTIAAPSGGRWIGDKRFYRWRKWQRRVRLDANRRLWPATAGYFAGPYWLDGRGLRSIVLVRRWSDTPAPWGDEAREWHEFEFFTLEADAARAGR